MNEMQEIDPWWSHSAMAQAAVYICPAVHRHRGRWRSRKKRMVGDKETKLTVGFDLCLIYTISFSFLTS